MGLGMDERTKGYSLLREGCGVLELTDVGVIELRGEDRKGWLQGQCTNDLRELRAGGFVEHCLTSHTGQLQAICSMWALPESLWLVTHRTSVDSVLSRVETHVVMEDVVASVPVGRLLSFQGPEASRVLGERLTLPALDAAWSDGLGLFRSNRTGLGGWDVWVPEGGDAEALLQGVPVVSQAAFALAAFEAGRPEFGVDTDAKTLPPELGPAFEAANISYKKGCYTGQEVLMRIHSRGHTNRTWRALMASSPIPLGPVSHSVRAEAGLVTRSLESPELGFIAGAMLRNEVSPGDRVRVGSVEAEVVDFPLIG